MAKFRKTDHSASVPAGIPLRLPRRAKPASHRCASASTPKPPRPPPPIIPEPPTPTNTHSLFPGNTALLPLRTRTRGPAPVLPPLSPPTTSLTVTSSDASYDPVDEALDLFRANTLFRNFEIKGPADRLLIYGILFVAQLLGVVRTGMGRREAERGMGALALDLSGFNVPGDAGFVLNQAL